MNLHDFPHVPKPNPKSPVSSRSKDYTDPTAGCGWQAIPCHLLRSWMASSPSSPVLPRRLLGGKRVEPFNWGGLWCGFFRGGVVETQGDRSSVVMFIFCFFLQWFGWILSSK